ncbi:MAG: CPBP family intramembrane metalloprotease [Clostridia bacterium]|nr:CPBP family intramembrane metalloprotease [Clostridia bacterium]
MMEDNFEWENHPDSGNEDTAWEQTAQAEALEQERQKMKRKIRFSANRIGWTTVLLIAAWMGFIVLFELIIGTLNSFGISGAMEFYNKYILIVNEVTLAIAISVAGMLLLALPKTAEEKRPMEFSRFLKLLVMCFGAAYIGNMIGNLFLTFWNASTGNSAGNELEALLTGMDPLIMFLSVGILAPLLEELFFRKLLIDRLRPLGKAVSILLPAFLFALFHMSATQLIYAFAVGVILAYLYYETGNYWLTVAVHALFNWISGFIPMLFLPKLNAFFGKYTQITEGLPETAGVDEITEQLIPLFETYGATLALYGFYALLVFAVNITGVVFLCMNIKKFRKLGEESVLRVSEVIKAAMLNPGMVVCTLALAALTALTLFTQ